MCNQLLFIITIRHNYQQHEQKDQWEHKKNDTIKTQNKLTCHKCMLVDEEYFVTENNEACPPVTCIMTVFTDEWSPDHNYVSAKNSVTTRPNKHPAIRPDGPWYFLYTIVPILWYIIFVSTGLLHRICRSGL